MVQATRYQWRAYDKTKTKYTILARDANENYQIWSATSMNTIMTNGNGWLTLDGKKTSEPTITFGDVVYIVCYAKNGNDMAPIANYEILYNNTYPKTREQILLMAITTAHIATSTPTISKLQSLYRLTMTIIR